MRVMQTFGEPRDTTNPYLVMLRDALVAEPTIEHVPFSWRAALTGRYDVLHVHWPDTLLAARHWWTRAGKRAALAALDVRLGRRRIAVVRTVHNVTPPSGPFLDRVLIRALERQTDVRIRISAMTPEADGVPSVLIPHGHYRDWFDGMPRAAAVRGRLGYVGLIKPYKGVERLVDAFAAASALDPTLTLRIAGKPTDEAVERRLRAASERLGGLETTLEYLGEAAFVEAVTSSELVVLPYRFMHNSGSRVGGALARPPRARPRQRPQSRPVVGGRGRLGAPVRRRAHGRCPARRHARGSHRTARGAARPRRPRVARRRSPPRPRLPPGDGPSPRPLDGIHGGGAVAGGAGTGEGHARTRRRHPDLPSPRRPRDRALGRPGAGRRRERRTGIADALLDPGRRQRSQQDRAGGSRRSTPVRYVIEPRPGIAAVRNRAIAECGDARAVLFIDDDEVPEPGWLRAMIGMYRSTGPTAVAGRVVTRFPDDVEPWVAASGAFIRPTRVHGQTMGEAATNNLLVDLDGRAPSRPVVRRALRAHRGQRQHVHAAAHPARRLDPVGRGRRRDRAGGSEALHAVVGADAHLPLRQHVGTRADRARAPRASAGPSRDCAHSGAVGRASSAGARDGASAPSRVRCAIAPADCGP